MEERQPLATVRGDAQNTRSLLALILLAFGLRVYRLSAQSLWYDEAVTAQVASRGIVELTRWTADDIQPPLYYYVVAGWTRLAGHGEWALRFPVRLLRRVDRAAALGIGAAAVRAGGPAGAPRGLVAALLAAVSPALRVLCPGSAHVHPARLPGRSGRLRAAAGRGQAQRAERVRSAGGWRSCWPPRRPSIPTILALFLLLAYGLCFLAAWLIRRAGTHPAGPVRR